MELQKIEIGMRVRCIENFEDTIEVGEEGEVLSVSDSSHPVIGVRWDQSHQEKHNLGNRCEHGHGYFVPQEVIESIPYTTELNESKFFDILNAF